MGNEVWKAMPGYEGAYEVSSLGRVRSIKRTTTKGGILKTHVNGRNGYVYVYLHFRGVGKCCRLHRLVAKAFLGEEEGLQVNHINGIKTDNRIENLEWCTQSENMKHAARNGLIKFYGLRVINLDTGDVYKTATDASRAIGGRRGEMVARVCRGERSHYRGMHFAFLNDYLNGTVPKYEGKVAQKASESLWV